MRQGRVDVERKGAVRAEEAADPGRRRVMRRLAYVAPVVAVLKLDRAMAQIGSPPPPPEVVNEPPE